MPSGSRVVPPLREALLGLRLLAELPIQLRRPLDSATARQALKRRLETRGADFLPLAHRSLFADPQHAGGWLLRVAGCEFGDLERLVQREGVEGALVQLLGAGVYLTREELTGRREVVRGSARRWVTAAQLRSQASGYRLRGLGSGGSGVAALPFDLVSVRDRTVNLRLFLGARGGEDWLHGAWGAPGGATLAGLIELRLAGLGPAAWFTSVDTAAADLPARYRWSERALGFAGALAGRGFPPPIAAPIEAPSAALSWFAATPRRGQVPHLLAAPSAAASLCRAAEQASLDLEGAQFTLIGEPVQAQQLEALERLGARGVPDYGSPETSGAIGYGCLRPVAPDEVHLCDDLHAAIQPANWSDRPTDLPPDTLLFTSLRAAAPLTLLNADIGDRARLAARVCGCPLEQLGWRQHVASIRRVGRAFLGGLMLWVEELEAVARQALPDEFGGRPTDYALRPASGPPGDWRFKLFVAPELGSIDAHRAEAALLDSLQRDPGRGPVLASLWRQSAALEVESSQAPAAPD